MSEQAQHRGPQIPALLGRFEWRRRIRATLDFMRRETSYDVLRRPSSRSGCRCRAELIAISYLEPTTDERACQSTYPGDFFGHLTRLKSYSQGASP